MKRLLLLLSLLFTIVNIVGFAQQSSSGQTSSDTVFLNYDLLRGEGDLQWKLRDQRWRYTMEDSVHFALPGYDASHWKIGETLFSDEDLDPRQLPTRGWFRLVLQADSNCIHTPSTIIFSGEGAIEVYLDGKLLRRVGRFSDSVAGEYFILTHTPAFFALDTPGVHVLSVRYENLSAEDFDEWGFVFTFDSPENVFERLVAKAVMQLSCLLPVGSLFFTLFLIHFLLFLFYRKEVFNLHFAIFCLSIAIIIFSIAYMLHAQYNIANYVSIVFILQLCGVAGFYAFSSFCTRLFSKSNLIYKIIIGIALVTVAAIIITQDPDGDIPNSCLFILAICSIAYSLFLIIRAIVTKVPGARVLGAGIVFFFLFITVIVTIAVINNGEFSTSNAILGTIFFLSLLLAVFSIPISISSYLAWRFAHTNRKLQYQLTQVEALSQQQLQLEHEKQMILENQKEALEQEVAIRTEDLRIEKKKADDLLLNILPLEIAEELKATGKSKAQLYNEVTVMFTDFVNFTQLSEQLGVDELLEELNIYFTAFDKIMEKYGLEKIKTIGDAYLAVSGLPIANERHAHNAVLAAFEILDFVSKRKEEVPYSLDIRIGINSGPLIAGIIGVKKFAYDIWGDTVNIAARMEQSGAPGKINISSTTYNLINSDFACEHRGRIDAKHKGEMDMYFVTQSQSR